LISPLGKTGEKKKKRKEKGEEEGKKERGKKLVAIPGYLVIDLFLQNLV